MEFVLHYNAKISTNSKQEKNEKKQAVYFIMFPKS